MVDDMDGDLAAYASFAMLPVGIAVWIGGKVKPEAGDLDGGPCEGG